MAVLDFPATPSIGQVATPSNGFSYQWDGEVWMLTTATGATAGGDLSGTYPNPQIATGVIVDADVNVAAAIQYSKLKQEYARVYRALATPQSIPNGTWTALTFTTAEANVGGMWNVGSPDRLVTQQAGFYLVGANAQFSDATGPGTDRLLSIYVGGALVAGFSGKPVAYAWVGATGGVGISSAGTAITVSVYQNSGAALNVAASGVGIPSLWAIRLG